MCRGCGKTLDGPPYHKGGSAYVTVAGPNGRTRRIRALAHFYGGWICSAKCNRRVFAQMSAANVYSSDDARRMRDGDAYFENA